VSLKWILQSEVAQLSLVTKADTKEYIEEDVSLFDWSLTKEEMHTLDAATSPSSVPSWGCTS
jgi:diketogulonate reductase-like aldo/keto reductase